MLAEEKKAKVISRNPHPILIELPTEKEPTRLSDIQTLIMANCRKRDQIGIFGAAWRMMRA